MNKLARLLLVIGVAATIRLQADPIIYGSAYSGPGAPASLYNINPNTGAATLIGGIGFNQVGAIDFSITSGVLYGVGKRTIDGTQVLLTINPTTGAGTEVGPTGLSSDLQDVSFRSDDTLFAYVSGNIYTVSLATGAATLVGNAGDGFQQGDGLAFSATDILFKADNANLSTINQTNGAATIVTGMSYPILGSRANGMDFDGGTGILWASVTTGSSGTNYLATINITNGVVTYIGGTQTRLDALTVIPEPGALTLVCLSLAGLLAIGRRKK